MSQREDPVLDVGRVRTALSWYRHGRSGLPDAKHSPNQHPEILRRASTFHGAGMFGQGCRSLCVTNDTWTRVRRGARQGDIHEQQSRVTESPTGEAAECQPQDGISQRKTDAAADYLVGKTFWEPQDTDFTV